MEEGKSGDALEEKDDEDGGKKEEEKQHWAICLLGIALIGIILYPVVVKNYDQTIKERKESFPRTEQLSHPVMPGNRHKHLDQ